MGENQDTEATKGYFYYKCMVVYKCAVMYVSSIPIEPTFTFTIFVQSAIDATCENIWLPAELFPEIQICSKR